MTKIASRNALILLGSIHETCVTQNFGVIGTAQVVRGLCILIYLLESRAFRAGIF